MFMGLLVLLGIFNFAFLISTPLCYSTNDRELFDGMFLNLYAIPVLPGVLLGKGVYFIIASIPELKRVKNFHKFMCKNPLDLVKFRIRIEKK